MKPTFYIMRHGQSITNVNRVIHARVADPAVWLTPKGHDQAKAGASFLAKHLAGLGMRQPRKLRIMRSTYKRAVQTAEHVHEAISQLSIPSIEVKSLDRLRELEFGYVGALESPLPYVDWLTNILRYQGFKYFAPRFGGESPASMEPRIRSALDAMYRDFQENNVTHFIVPCHGMTVRVLTRCIMDYDNTWYETEDNPDNCAIRLIADGKDEGYIFPNPNGQWDPAWKEPEENKAKLNPDGLFFSPEQMAWLQECQEKHPEVMERLAWHLEHSPGLRAVDLIGRVQDELKK